MSSGFLIQWLGDNYVEVLGAVLGIVYIFLSIRQNILAWPVGLATSAIYVFVFFVSKFYADMALQVYYVGISIYGWYFWLKGKPAGTDGLDEAEKGNSTGNNNLPVSNMPLKYLFPLIGITLLLFGSIIYILINYTDSPIPVWDSLTTALGIAATWMLARKYIENWVIWIIVDILSAILYAFKDLWPTVILYLVYTVMAGAGYFKWRKEIRSSNLKLFHEQDYCIDRT